MGKKLLCFGFVSISFNAMLVSFLIYGVFIKCKNKKKNVTKYYSKVKYNSHMTVWPLYILSVILFTVL